jgi:3-oxoacyl-[acyl-carrier-protein] synthase II
MRYGFDPAKRVDHKIQRQVDPFIIYGLDAAGQALEDAGLTDMSEEERYRSACRSAPASAAARIEKESIVLHEKGPRGVSRISCTGA